MIGFICGGGGEVGDACRRGRGYPSFCTKLKHTQILGSVLGGGGGESGFRCQCGLQMGIVNHK